MASRIKYTINDETAMWRFVMRVLHEGRGASIKGNVIWAEFSEFNTAPDCCVRSISSLNSHFRKKMLPTLAGAEIPLEDIVYIHNKIPLTSFDIKLFTSRCNAAEKPNLLKKLKKRNYFVPKFSQDIFEESLNDGGSPVPSPSKAVNQPGTPRRSLNESVAKVIENCQIRRCREQNPYLGLRNRVTGTNEPRRSRRLANISQNLLNVEEPNQAFIEPSYREIVSPKPVKKKSILVAAPILIEPAVVIRSPVTRSASRRRKKAVPIVLEPTTSKDAEEVDVVLDSNPQDDDPACEEIIIVDPDVVQNKRKQCVPQETPKKRCAPVQTNISSPTESFYDSDLLNKLLDTNLEDVVYESTNRLPAAEAVRDREDREGPILEMELPFFRCEMSEEFVSELLQGVDDSVRKHLCLELLLHREFLRLLSDSTSSDDFQKKLDSLRTRFKSHMQRSPIELISLTQKDITTANFGKFSKPLNIPGTKVAWDVRLEFLNELFSSLAKYPVAKTIKMRYQLINVEGNAAQLGSLQQDFYEYFVKAIRSQFVLT